MKAQSIVNMINHIYDNNGKKQSIDALLQGTNQVRWADSLSNKIGRIAQGIHDIKGNDIVYYIKQSGIPKHKVVAYANFICDFRPLKSEQ